MAYRFELWTADGDHAETGGQTGRRTDRVQGRAEDVPSVAFDVPRQVGRKSRRRSSRKQFNSTSRRATPLRRSSAPSSPSRRPRSPVCNGLSLELEHLLNAGESSSGLLRLPPQRRGGEAR
jgi:hypothetical protein